MKSALLSPLALTALLVFQAHATPVIHGNTLANPGQHIDFSEIDAGGNAALTNQYASLGVTFEGFYYNGCSVGCVEIPAKPDIGNFFNVNTSVYSLYTAMHFNADLQAATFGFASNGAQFQMSAYQDGALVEAFAADGSQWGQYGFTGIVFDEIRITNQDEYGGAFLVDDLAFTHAAPQAVPEPSTWAMFSVALAALSFAGLRRRRS